MQYKGQATRQEVSIIGIIVFSIYAISVLVWAFQIPDQVLGMIPGQWSTSYSIVTMAWVHGDMNHLLNNLAMLIPYLLLLALVSDRMHVIYCCIAITAGVLIFFFHPRAIIIGVSGVVFGLPSYLVLRTVLDPEFWCHIATHIKAGFWWISIRDFCTQAVIMFAILLVLYRDLDQLLFNLQPKDGVSNLSHIYGMYSGIIVFSLEFVYLFWLHFWKKVPYTHVVVEQDKKVRI